MKINRYINEQKLNEDESFLTTSDGIHTDTPIDTVLDHSKNPKELKDNFIDWIRLRKLSTSIGPNENIAKILNNYDPSFIEYFIKCMGKNALSDGGNLFINFLNNPAAKNVVGYDRNNFTDAYNILLRNNNIDLNYVKDGDSLLYLPELYSNLDSNDTRNKLINLDMKAKGKGLGESAENTIIEKKKNNGKTNRQVRRAENRGYSKGVTDTEAKYKKDTGTDSSSKPKITRADIKDAIKNRTVDDLFRQNNVDNSYVTPVEKIASKIGAMNDDDKKRLAKYLVGSEKSNALINAMKDKENADKGKG